MGAATQAPRYPNERLAAPPAIRDLYSRLPEMYYRQPWELQHVLFSLGYTDDLAAEADIAAALEVARGDYPQWRLAA